MVLPEAAPPVNLGPGPPRPATRRPPGSFPLPSTPPPPTRPRSDDGSTPTQLLPAPCSVSSRPEDTGPSSYPEPERRSGWDKTNMGDGMAAVR